jgi:hypothetical protein
MKYRIVKRNTNIEGKRSSYPFYYAQMKLFEVWIDCNLNPFVDTYYAWDSDLSKVEKWVNKQLLGEQPLKEEVVKTYD